MVIFEGSEIEEGLSQVEWARNTFVKTIGTSVEDEFNYNMRIFVIRPGGEIPLHRHNKAFHLQYVLEGKLKIIIDEEEDIAKARDVIYVPSGTKHKYINIWDTRVVFLCVTPLFGDKTEILE